MPLQSMSWSQRDRADLSGGLTLRQRLARPVRPVRVRLTVIGAALVTAALLIAGGVMVLVLHNVLLHQADATDATRADQIAAALVAGDVKQLSNNLLSTDHNVDLVQVLDQSGAVLRSSRPQPSAGLGGPLAPGQRVVVDGARALPLDTEYRATRLGVRDGTGAQLVIEVGTAEEGLNRVVLVVAALCAAVFPVIVVVMVVLTYLFVGRALSPVDQIRQQVDAIGEADLAERVPVPRTGDELETLARTMNAMLARLEAAQLAQRRFVGDASHELNSPLTSIYGLLDLAIHTNTPIDLETVSTLLLPEATRMRVLVADLAALARADERVLLAHRDEVDMAELVEEAAMALRATTTLDIRVTTVPALVDGNPDHLRRAVRNLTDNASRFARHSISVEVSTIDGLVRVSVADDGPGVPQAARARVFERFARLDAERSRASGGSGLGLAIVAEIVAAHGGSVGVDDAPDGGANFWFSLPAAQSGSRHL